MSTPRYDKLDHPDILATIFHPRAAPLPPSDGDTESLNIEVADGVTISGRFHFAAPEDPHILFFHGNGELAVEYDDAGAAFRRHGLNFIAVDYRGYGASGGEPTATALMADCHAILTWLRERLTKDGRTGPVFVMGRSLGSAPAIELAHARKEEIKGLIIESGFAQTLPLLLDLGVDVGALGVGELDGCKNVQKMERIDLPVYILHAGGDELIPLANAEMLHSVCPARHKELQIVPGCGHNDIMANTGDLYFKAVKQFTDKVLKVRRRRVR